MALSPHINAVAYCIVLPGYKKIRHQARCRKSPKGGPGFSPIAKFQQSQNL